MRRGGMRSLALCGVFLGLALLTGCGKKGDLSPLPGEYEAFTWPQQYPAPSTVVPGLTEEEEEGLERFPGPVAGEPLPTIEDFHAPGALGRRDSDRTTTQFYRSQ